MKRHHQLQARDSSTKTNYSDDYDDDDDDDGDDYDDFDDDDDGEDDHDDDDDDDGEDEETPSIASKRQFNKKQLIAKQQGASSLEISGEVNYLGRGERELKSQSLAFIGIIQGDFCHRYLA